MKKYEKLIDSIKNWKNYIINKSDELKSFLKEQNIFLEKKIFNFNYNYLNFAYYSNFYRVNEYIKTFNEKYYSKIVKF